MLTRRDGAAGFEPATRAALELARAGIAESAPAAPGIWEQVPQAALLAGCDRHGLVALARKGLPRDAPEDLVTALNARLPGLWARNRRLLDACVAACAALQRAQISCVLLKGVDLLPLVYGDVAARPSSDIDLLVPRRELRRAVSVLREVGYAAPASWDEGSFRLHDFHVPLEHTSPPRGSGASAGILLELHWELASRGRYQIGADEVLERSRPVAAGPAVRTVTGSNQASEQHDDGPAEAARIRTALAEAGARRLAPEDLLVHLCVHATTSYLVGRLAWLFDILVAARVEKPDWQVVLDRAERSQARTATALALAACRELVGLELDESLCGRIQLPAWRLAALDWMLARQPRHPAAGRWWRTGYAPLVMDRPVNVLRHARMALVRDLSGE